MWSGPIDRNFRFFLNLCDLSNIIVNGKGKTLNRDENDVVHKVNCNFCKYIYVRQSKRSFDVRKINLIGKIVNYYKKKGMK